MASLHTFGCLNPAKPRATPPHPHPRPPFVMAFDEGVHWGTFVCCLAITSTHQGSNLNDLLVRTGGLGRNIRRNIGHLRIIVKILTCSPWRASKMILYLNGEPEHQPLNRNPRAEAEVVWWALHSSSDIFQVAVQQLAILPFT